MTFTHVRHFLVVIALGLGVIACSPIGYINSAVSRETFNLVADIPYGPEERQKLDVYAPKGVKDAPVLVFVHGGSWRDGDRSDYPFLGESFANAGYVTVIISYRLAPQTVFPGFVNDAALALKWVKDNALKHGGNSSRIYLMGHSAGAHIAALIALDPSYLKAVGLDRNVLSAVVGIAGPYDFEKFIAQSPELQQVFGPQTNWANAMPINHVDGANPPMLLLQGLADTTVDPVNATNLEAKIKAKGGRVEVIRYPGLGHREIIGAVSKAGRFLESKVLPDIVGFLKKN
jgi:acetyl esterase/lipase